VPPPRRRIEDRCPSAPNAAAEPGRVTAAAPRPAAPKVPVITRIPLILSSYVKIAIEPIRNVVVSLRDRKKAKPPITRSSVSLKRDIQRSSHNTRLILVARREPLRRSPPRGTSRTSSESPHVASLGEYEPAAPQSHCLRTRPVPGPADYDRRADPMRNSNSFAALPGQPGGGGQKPDECLRLPDPFWKDQIQSASDQADLVLHSGPAMRRGMHSPATLSPCP
jgi:hypothetical protein